MSTTTTSDMSDHMITTLRAHDAGSRSDVDLAAELDPNARIGPFARAALERRLAKLIGRPVELLPEPVEKPRLRANIDRNRRRAF